ncbi:NAD(P)-binding protein [Aulographum hederae CBS 113979]|uniref:NAD(P)-binding protein n=1 Tax=Aulographum hederae CBS 113979 TaxID=1176131 RepID=A0A6G1GWA3_9PEZI|nr:NAD(P)-binding protein [Aulographum hederae CBS 113979]
MAASTEYGREWKVVGTTGFDSLQYNEKALVPRLGDKEVLVRFKAASLNYRDLVIPMGKYPAPHREGVVPGSDGAGIVEAAGGSVKRFKIGDRVGTLFNQDHQAGSLTPDGRNTGLGGCYDGTLRDFGAFDETGLVHLPGNLNFLEASTLTCAGLTAWNALYGLKSRSLKQGDVVLTQGTGGVSMFAVQFARASGATVISTTSSNDKASILKKLGAKHVINYKEDPNWGETAKKLTPGGLGVSHILEVGGPATMSQSLKAIKIGGVISIIGFLSSASKDQPTFLDCLKHLCIVRGIIVGSRLQFEEMIRAVEANDIHPIIDEKVFKLEEVKEAYQYMWDQKHFGKLCLEIA